MAQSAGVGAWSSGRKGSVIARPPIPKRAHRLTDLARDGEKDFSNVAAGWKPAPRTTPTIEPMPEPPIYLDNNATTAIDPRVVEAMTRAWRDCGANPASQHGPGRAAR